VFVYSLRKNTGMSFAVTPTFMSGYRNTTNSGFSPEQSWLKPIELFLLPIHELKLACLQLAGG
jgi:hypothetical protein